MKQYFLYSPNTKYKTVTEQRTNGIKSSFDINGLFKTFVNPEGLAMIGILVFLILLSQFSGNKKGKISTGRVVGISEKLAATNLALKQIEERFHNKVTFWCGSPRYWFSGRFRKFGASFQTFFGASPTVWIPLRNVLPLFLALPVPVKLSAQLTVWQKAA